MHTLFTSNISEFTEEGLKPVFFYVCSYKISPNLLKHSCDTMSFIGTRPRLNTAVFPAYIAQNESEESYMYSY